MKPCLTCGEPTQDTRCEEHTVRRVKASRSAGYDHAWDKLSARARRIQPWCSDCHTIDDLTTDHSERAWRRRAEGKVIRLRDVDVVCRSCNAKRGRARPTGVDPRQTPSDPAGQAESALHTPGGYA